MLRSPRNLLVLALLLVLPAASDIQAGELVDAGPGGHFFYDADTDLYWFDAVTFESETRAAVDMFVTASPRWSWATSTQIDALVGQTSPAGQILEDVMGEAQTGGGGALPRWLGFHSGTGQPDGWLVQDSVAPYTELDASGSQSNAAGQTCGAWVVSTGDPASSPRLTDLGDAGEYFHDEDTNLYWCDPATFVGFTRADVVGWLADHPAFRWATSSEVQSLVGKMAAGDVALVEILGTPQIDGLTPRWIGYYEQEAQPDGLLLEARWFSPRSLVSIWGTQSGAVNWDPGAWVVTESDPTPVEGATWSGVKELFR